PHPTRRLISYSWSTIELSLSWGSSKTMPLTKPIAKATMRARARTGRTCSFPAQSPPIPQ
ncbi:MAG: hypothetical protein ACO3QZ_04100, partial [Candidatus Nanopelagicaceae bacterium]